MTAATGQPHDRDPGGRDRHESATVAAVLPNELFRLRLQDGSERLAHVAGDLRKGFTRLLPGDVVRIELSPLDPTKARILARLPQQRR